MYLTKRASIELAAYQWSLALVSYERVYDHIYNGGFTRVNVPHNHCVVIFCSLFSARDVCCCS